MRSGGGRGWEHAGAWKGRLGSLRNVVRQEVVSRQLAGAVDGRVGRALDVGAGQGTQALALARRGWEVDALDPDPAMRAACDDARATAPVDVAARVHTWSGDLTGLADGRPGGLPATHDLVLCHGVVMYLPDPEPVVATLAGRVTHGGHLSILARNAAAVPFRPARRGDWPGALAAFDEAMAATHSGRDVTYTNGLGASCRADRVEHLVGLLAAHGLVDVRWFGVRVAVDVVDPDVPAPSDPAELAALLDVEERLGAADPFRAVAPLVHVLGRRP